MENIKLNDLTSTFDKYAGRRANFSVESKHLKLSINGQIQKDDKRYWFTSGANKVVVEQKTAGSIFSFKGTYIVITIVFMAGEHVLVVVDIPAKGNKFSFDIAD